MLTFHHSLVFTEKFKTLFDISNFTSTVRLFDGASFVKSLMCKVVNTNKNCTFIQRISMVSIFLNKKALRDQK